MEEEGSLGTPDTTESERVTMEVAEEYGVEDEEEYSSGEEEESGEESSSEEEDDLEEGEVEEGDEENGEIDEDDDDDDEDEEDDDEEEEEEEEDENETEDGEVEGAAAEDGAASSDDQNCDRCPICLNRLKQQDIGMPEACDHLFCLECIQEWSKNVNTCPVDRQVFHLILAKHAGEEKVFKQFPVENRQQLELEEEEAPAEDDTACEVCGLSDREDRLLLCDSCDAGYHCDCLDPPLDSVPVQEWFCPDCVQQRNRVEEEPLQHGRQIARTRVSERVRRIIADARAERTERRRIVAQRIADRENAMDQEPVPLPGPSSRRRGTKRKRTTSGRKTTKKRKTTAKKRKTTKKRKATKKRTPGKKTKRKTKKKRKSPKKSPAASPFPPALARTAQTSATVKGRIADKLGLKPPPRGRTIPTVRGPSSGASGWGAAGGSGRHEAAPNFSIMGNKNELYSFADQEGEERVPVNRPAIPASTLSRSALSSHRPLGQGRIAHARRSDTAASLPVSALLSVSQPGGSGTTPTSASTSAQPSQSTAAPGPFDLLGSIMSNQTMLHKGGKHITINRDGSLTAAQSGLEIHAASRHVKLNRSPSINSPVKETNVSENTANDSAPPQTDPTSVSTASKVPTLGKGGVDATAVDRGTSRGHSSSTNHHHSRPGNSVIEQETPSVSLTTFTVDRTSVKHHPSGSGDGPLSDISKDDTQGKSVSSEVIDSDFKAGHDPTADIDIKQEYSDPSDADSYRQKENTVGRSDGGGDGVHSGQTVVAGALDAHAHMNGWPEGAGEALTSQQESHTSGSHREHSQAGDQQGHAEGRSAHHHSGQDPIHKAQGKDKHHTSKASHHSSHHHPDHHSHSSSSSGGSKTRHSTDDDGNVGGSSSKDRRHAVSNPPPNLNFSSRPLDSIVPAAADSSTVPTSSGGLAQPAEAPPEGEDAVKQEVEEELPAETNIVVDREPGEEMTPGTSAVDRAGCRDTPEVYPGGNGVVKQELGVKLASETESVEKQEIGEKLASETDSFIKQEVKDEVAAETNHVSRHENEEETTDNGHYCEEQGEAAMTPGNPWGQERFRWNQHCMQNWNGGYGHAMEEGEEERWYEDDWDTGEMWDEPSDYGGTTENSRYNNNTRENSECNNNYGDSGHDNACEDPEYSNTRENSGYKDSACESSELQDTHGSSEHKDNTCGNFKYNDKDNASWPEDGREEGEASDSGEEGEVKEEGHDNMEGDYEEGEIVDEDDDVGVDREKVNTPAKGPVVTEKKSKTTISSSTDSTVTEKAVSSQESKQDKDLPSESGTTDKVEGENGVDKESDEEEEEEEESTDDDFDPNDPTLEAFMIGRFLESLKNNEFDRKKERAARNEAIRNRKEERARRREAERIAKENAKFNIYDFIGNASAKKFGVFVPQPDPKKAEAPVASKGRGRGRGAGGHGRNGEVQPGENSQHRGRAAWDRRDQAWEGGADGVEHQDRGEHPFSFRGSTRRGRGGRGWNAPGPFPYPAHHHRRKSSRSPVRSRSRSPPPGSRGHRRDRRSQRIRRSRSGSPSLRKSSRKGEKRRKRGRSVSEERPDQSSGGSSSSGSSDDDGEEETIGEEIRRDIHLHSAHKRSRRGARQRSPSKLNKSASSEESEDSGSGDEDDDEGDNAQPEVDSDEEVLAKIASPFNIPLPSASRSTIPSSPASPPSPPAYSPVGPASPAEPPPSPPPAPKPKQQRNRSAQQQQQQSHHHPHQPQQHLQAHPDHDQLHQQQHSQPPQAPHQPHPQQPPQQPVHPQSQPHPQHHPQHHPQQYPQATHPQQHAQPHPHPQHHPQHVQQQHYQHHPQHYPAAPSQHPQQPRQPQHQQAPPHASQPYPYPHHAQPHPGAYPQQGQPYAQRPATQSGHYPAHAPGQYSYPHPHPASAAHPRAQTTQATNPRHPAPGQSSAAPSHPAYHYYPTQSTSAPRPAHPQSYPYHYGQHPGYSMPARHPYQPATSVPSTVPHTASGQPYPYSQQAAYHQAGAPPARPSTASATTAASAMASRVAHPYSGYNTHPAAQHPTNPAQYPATKPASTSYGASSDMTLRSGGGRVSSPPSDGVRPSRVSSYRISPSEPSFKGVATSDRIASNLLLDEVKKGFRTLVEDAVRSALRPAWSAKKVTKEEYKDIFKRAVDKVCGSKETVVQQDKIQLLVEAYVAKARKARTS